MLNSVVQVSEYTVSLLPETGVNYSLYVITVEYRGADRWAVVWQGYCLGADGEWEYEPSPSGRTEEWLTAHRFDVSTALRLARKHAPELTVNGISAAEAYRRERGDR